MADTVIEAVYVAAKTQFDSTVAPVSYPYRFDGSTLPYLYMSEVGDPRDKAFLCSDKGGNSRITFGYISDDFVDCVDTLESIIDWVENNIIGNFAPIYIWDANITDVRDLTGLEQAETKVYRREFDVIVSWEKP